MITPWTATVRDRTLVVTFPTSYQVLSWAPLNGGLVEARAILNHQVDIHEYPTLEPAVYLSSLAQRLQVEEPVVGLMTGVRMDRLVRKVIHTNGLQLECFATVGLSNALAVGDPPTYEEHTGTINLIVVLNQALSPSALIEAVQIATEAKVQGLYAAKVKSTVTDTLATGTGTDCVAVACPPGEPIYQYCGKHTRLGELLGRVVGQAMEEGIQRAGVTGG
jgi:adenosylcobinamide amidohydrolase